MPGAGNKMLYSVIERYSSIYPLYNVNRHECIRSHLILTNNFKRPDLLFPFHSMKIGLERRSYFTKVIQLGSGGARV